MERTTKPDVQSIEDGITQLALETTCSKTLTNYGMTKDYLFNKLD